MMYSTAIFIVINLALFGGSSGQLTENLPSADEILQKASEVAGIPGLNASALPVEEVKSAFKSKCDTNGGPGTFAKTEVAAKDIEGCIRGLVNVSVLQEEIEEAKPTGDLDIVFRRYCNKTPILKSCVTNFTNTVEACFEQKERENIRLIQNITDSLLSFVCFKEGDRIALFIAAGGPECLSSKQMAIQDCVNSSFSHYLPADGLNPTSAGGLENIPLLLLGTKECTDIQKLQHCAVRELETCSDPTPGNIVDSLFNYIKKVTPCEKLLMRARDNPNAAEVTGSSTMIGAQIVTVALTLLAMRFV